MGLRGPCLNRYRPSAGVRRQSHAAGKTYTVPVLVTLWGRHAVRNHQGEYTYTTMTMIFPGKRPAVYVDVNGKWHASYPVTQTLGF